MSWSKRKHALRDAIAAELPGQANGIPKVEACVAPTYKPEDLADNPRTPVWLAGVEAANVQGPDWNTVTIGIGVIGLTFDATGYSQDQDSRRMAELAASDALDDHLSDILGLFTPGDPPRSLYILEDFRFQDVGQPLQLDTALFRENGVWLGAIFLTYLDQLDE